MNDQLSHVPTFLNNAKYSDVQLIVEDKSIYAHKFVLASKSDVFGAMLYGSLSSQEKPQCTITINDPGVTYDAFLKFLGFFYGKELELDFSSVLETIYLATKYNIQDILDITKKFIEENLTEENAIAFLTYTDILSATSIQESCLKFIIRKTPECLKHAKKVQISVDMVKLILENDELNAPEIALFDFAQEWFQNQEKQDDFREIFSLIRYSQNPARDLITKVKPTNLAPEKLYYEALEFLLAPDTFDRDLLRFNQRGKN